MAETKAAQMSDPCNIIIIGLRHGLNDEDAVDGPVATDLACGVDVPEHLLSSRHPCRGRGGPRLGALP